MKSYTMEVRDEAVIVRGSVPIGDARNIQKFGESFGFDIIDACVGYCLGAVMVLTDKEGAVKLRAEIDEQNAGKSPEDAWISGWDRGISSETIFHVMTGRPMLGRVGVPHDPDDFGRCYRLLEKFPGWKQRIREVAEQYPEWARIVEHWDWLSAMYAAGDNKTLYARIQELTEA
jgi:hypothetical protein